MDKRYTLTRENCDEIIKRIRSFTDRYKMESSNRVFSLQNGEKRNSEEKYSKCIGEFESWGVRCTLNDFGLSDEVTEEPYYDVLFVRVLEITDTSCDDRKILIQIEKGPYQIINVKEGDTVRFEEDRFTVYVDNIDFIEDTRYVYEHTLIIDRDRREITDKQYEIDIRNKEIERYCYSCCDEDDEDNADEDEDNECEEDNYWYDEKCYTGYYSAVEKNYT